MADRAALFERVAPYKRASNLKRGRSPFLADQHRKLVRQLRARLLRWLPELRDAPADLVEALDQATSFEAWDRLRSDQRLGRPRARAAMERAVKASGERAGGRTMKVLRTPDERFADLEGYTFPNPTTPR